MQLKVLFNLGKAYIEGAWHPVDDSLAWCPHKLLFSILIECCHLVSIFMPFDADFTSVLCIFAFAAEQEHLQWLELLVCFKGSTVWQHPRQSDWRCLDAWQPAPQFITKRFIILKQDDVIKLGFTSGLDCHFAGLPGFAWHQIPIPFDALEGTKTILVHV